MVIIAGRLINCEFEWIARELEQISYTDVTMRWEQINLNDELELINRVVSCQSEQCKPEVWL
jgi:hypothetical protein